MILFKIFIKGILENIREFYKNKKFFLLSGIILIISFFSIILLTFYILFKYLIVNIPGGYTFAPKMLGFIILIIFSFIIILSYIATIATFFKTQELKLILPLPIREKDIFIYGLLKLIYFSIYGTLFVLLPVFIAYGLSLNLHFIYYIIISILLISLTIIATIFAVILFWISNYILFKIKKYVGLLYITIFLAISYIVYYSFKEIDGKNNLGFLEKIIFNFDFQNNLYLYNWFTKTIFYFQNQNYILSILYILLIISFTYILYKVTIFICSKTYLKSLEYFESLRKKETKKINFYTIFTKNKYINLILKDLLIHIKDSNQRSQILIFISLMFIYILAIQGNTEELGKDYRIVSLLTLGGIAISSFFISAISLRFIYPNISLEGKSFWLLKTIPIKLWKIFLLKFIFFFIIIYIISHIIVLFYINNFNLLNNISNYLFILNIFTSFFITSLYFGFGAIFPNFKESNPSKIATSYGGLLSIFISNFIILLLLSILYNPLLIYYYNLQNCNNIDTDNIYIKTIIISSILLVVGTILLYISYNKFKKIEL